MKHFFMFVLACAIVFQSFAQDLSNHIPAHAAAVFRIHTDQLFKLVEKSDFNGSMPGKSLMKNVNEAFQTSISDVDELGLELTSSTYFFPENNDSAFYTVWLLPVKDASKLDAIAKNAPGQFSKEDELRFYSASKSGTLYTWNDHALCIMTGEAIHSYFEDPAFLERNHIESPYANFVDSAAIEVDSLAGEDMVIDTVVVPEPEDSVALNWDEDADSTTMEDTDDSIDESNPYAVYYQKLTELKRVLIQKWIRVEAAHLIHSHATPSINTIPAFQDAMQSNSVADLWVPDLSHLFGSLMPAYFQGVGILYYGYSNIRAHLIADGSQIKITVAADLDQEKAAMNRKLTGKKTPKAFYKYIPSDKAIGYVHYSIDSRAYLEMLPNIITNSIKSSLPSSESAGDISFVGDFIAMLIDEEAISKLIKGDFLFVLNDFSTKEVTYTDYEYDDDFNGKPVEKTKMEQVPEFLMLITSDDKALVNKFLRYLAANGMCHQQGDLYEFDSPGMPISLYVGFGDGLVAIGTSSEQLLAVQQGKSLGAISEAHKNMLKNNWFDAWFSPARLAKQLESGNEKTNDLPPDMLRLLHAASDIRITYNRIKGNTITGEMVMDAPTDQKNGLAYLFSLMTSAVEK